MVRDNSFNSSHMSCNLIQFCTFFLTWFRGNSFAYFRSLPVGQTFLSETHLKIHKSYSFSESDLKHEIALTKNLLRKESKLSTSLEQFVSFICSYLKSCVWLLLVAVTLPITSASRQRNFSRMKLVKWFPRNSTASERLGNIDLL